MRKYTRSTISTKTIEKILSSPARKGVLTIICPAYMDWADERWHRNPLLGESLVSEAKNGV